MTRLVPRPSSSSRHTGTSGFDRTLRIRLRETRLAATFAAAALFSPVGMLAIPSSRAAAFESTMSCVSVSSAIFGSLSLRQHPLPPARPRHGQIASGVRERAAFSGSGNTHRNAPFRHEVQSDHWGRSREVLGGTWPRLRPFTAKTGVRVPLGAPGVREFESSQPSHPVLAIAQSPLSREKLRNSAGLRGHLHAETENSPFSVKFGASNRPQSPADILKSPEFG